MKIYLCFILILFCSCGCSAQYRDTTYILSDSEAVQEIAHGARLRTVYNPVTQRYVCVKDVMLLDMPIQLYFDSNYLSVDSTNKNKRIIKIKK